jgi:predicted transcriptional regulator
MGRFPFVSFALFNTAAGRLQPINVFACPRAWFWLYCLTRRYRKLNKSIKEIAMKKTFLAVLMILLWTVSSVVAAEIKVGDSAAGFKLNDPKGVEYSLDSTQYKGKVVIVFYGDPGSKDLNNDLQNALKAAREAGTLDKKNYEGLGVVNVKDSIVPNFVLRSIIKSKQEETKATILIDPDYTVLNLWSLTKKTSNIIMLDKQRVCRYIYKGKVPAADIAKIIALVQEYQVK